jgi:hypothetical protein
MALKDRKMIPYTEEDFIVLFRMLNGRNSDLKSLVEASFDQEDIKFYINPVAIKKPKGVTIRMLWPTLRKIIKEGNSVPAASKWDTDARDMWVFLHDVPFNKVPLHLHEYPELVKWRLTIKK